MNSTLPPTRDLPPGRQAQIRAELEGAVSLQTRRRPRFVPLLAAAAAVTSVVTGVVVLAPDKQQAPPAGQTTSSAKNDFGLRSEQITAIEQGCAKAESMSDKLTLHQVGSDAASRWALLYGDRVVVACNLDRAGEEYEASRPEDVFIDWLPGHFSVDIVTSRLGGDIHPSIPQLAGLPGYRIIAGRVDSSVARITYQAEDGRTAEAAIANGTYVARITYPSNWSPDNGNRTYELRAYDSAGNVLGTNADLDENCYYATDSKAVIHRKRDIPVDQCKPATRWH